MQLVVILTAKCLVTGSIVLKRIACKKTQPIRQTFGSFNRFQGISKLDSNPNLGTKIKGKTTNLIEQPPVCAMAARPVYVSDGGFVLCHGPVAPRCPASSSLRNATACLLTAVHRLCHTPLVTTTVYADCCVFGLWLKVEQSFTMLKNSHLNSHEYTPWDQGPLFRSLFRGALYQQRKCAWIFQNFSRMSGLCFYLCRDLSIKSGLGQFLLLHYNIHYFTVMDVHVLIL